MANKVKHLGEAELEIMQAIWGTKGSVRSSYIQEKLTEHRSWPLSAVVTALNRLVEKGFLSCQKEGRGNCYAALISEEEYRQAESKSFLGRLYGNSFTGLVASLYNGKAIGKEDLAELRRFLDELEGE